MASGIYVIANKVTGKCYVGSSVDIARRWKRHLYELRCGNHHSSKLQNSYLKHGEGAFCFSMVELCSKRDFQEFEQRWLDHLNAHADGYNVCPKACDVSTLPKSEEHKRRIGEAQLGRKRSLPAKENMSKAMTGKKRGPMSAELRAKISASLKGRAITPEARKKISAAKSGVKTGPCSDERRAAISKAKRARDAAKKGAPL